MVSWTQINIIKSDEVGVNPLMSKEKSRVDAKMAVKKNKKKPKTSDIERVYKWKLSPSSILVFI